MKLTAEEVDLILRALGRAVSRYESEARYAKSGKGANNYASTRDRAKKARELRDRIAQSIGLELKEPGLIGGPQIEAVKRFARNGA